MQLFSHAIHGAWEKQMLQTTNSTASADGANPSGVEGVDAQHTPSVERDAPDVNPTNDGATVIEIGHGLVDVGAFGDEKRIGLLLRPRPRFIPVGEPGELQNVIYQPVAGDVVIWLDGPELGQTIINELEAIARARATQVVA